MMVTECDSGQNERWEKSKECTQNTYAGDRAFTDGKSEEWEGRREREREQDTRPQEEQRENALSYNQAQSTSASS